MRPSLPLRVLCLGAALLPLASCSGSDGAGEDLTSQVTSVAVSPGSSQLTSIGATVTLSATPKDATGKTLSGTTITWSSSNSDVADVTVDGVVTAYANGTATITATATSLQATASGSATITVAQTAASVALTVPQDTLKAGETMQLSASAADEGGTPISDPSYTWASSDESVASVDSDGLVTAVGAGETTLSATADGARGEGDVTVLFVSVNVASDTTLSGKVVADTFRVAAGVTVTADADFELVASGPVTVDGTIQGDCVAMTIGGQSSVTLTGTLINACADASAEGGAVTIRADGALSMSGVTLNTSGDIVVANAALTSAPSAAPGVTSSALAALTEPQRSTAADSPCEFRSVKIAHNPLVAAPGRDGKGLLVRCLGEATFWGGNGFQAQSGGNGQPDFDDNDAEGDDGGDGGDVRIEVMEGDMIFMAETHDGITGTEMVAGDGGDGGLGEAEADDPGENVDALGGDGGDGGWVALETVNGSIRIEEFNGLSTLIGSGGDGGDANAIGGDGRDAGTEAAQRGGNADAEGGEAGRAGNAEMLTSGGAFEGLGNLIRNGANGGDGGDADAQGGKGGNGNAAFPNGANGGDQEATGGDGGKADLGENAQPFGNGGDAGDMSLSGGKGGAGADMCPTGTGGNGGEGGDGSTNKGTPGVGLMNGADGVEAVADGTGNGGAGGSGLTPGVGGDGGDDDTYGTWPNAFKDGPDGGGCRVETGVPVDVEVDDDPAGHNPYVQYYLVSLLNVVIDGNTIAFVGEAPWIDLTGTLDGNAFVATGEGTAAGVSGVSVSFEGTIERDEDGHVTAITGIVTIGVNGELYGVPVKYRVTNSG